MPLCLRGAGFPLFWVSPCLCVSLAVSDHEGLCVISPHLQSWSSAPPAVSLRAPLRGFLPLGLLVSARGSRSLGSVPALWLSASLPPSESHPRPASASLPVSPRVCLSEPLSLSSLTLSYSLSPSPSLSLGFSLLLPLGVADEKTSFKLALNRAWRKGPPLPRRRWPSPWRRDSRPWGQGSKGGGKGLLRKRRGGGGGGGGGGGETKEPLAGPWGPGPENLAQARESRKQRSSEQVAAGWGGGQGLLEPLPLVFLSLSAPHQPPQPPTSPLSIHVCIFPSRSVTSLLPLSMSLFLPFSLWPSVFLSPSLTVSPPAPWPPGSRSLCVSPCG